MLLIVGYHYFSVETIAHCYRKYQSTTMTTMTTISVPNNHTASLAKLLTDSVENLGCGGNDLRWGFYAVD